MCITPQIGWSKPRYDEVERTVRAFLDTVGYTPANVRFVPVSGLSGENLTVAPRNPDASWYTGPSLLQMIGSLIVLV